MKWFEPHENRQNPTRILDPGFRRICRIFDIFRDFFVCYSTKLNRTWKGVINARSYNRNKWYIFLILVRIWNQRKRCLGSWQMSRCGNKMASFVFHLAQSPLSAERKRSRLTPIMKLKIKLFVRHLKTARSDVIWWGDSRPGLRKQIAKYLTLFLAKKVEI